MKNSQNHMGSPYPKSVEFAIEFIDKLVNFNEKPHIRELQGKIDFIKKILSYPESLEEGYYFTMLDQHYGSTVSELNKMPHYIKDLFKGSKYCNANGELKELVLNWNSKRPYEAQEVNESNKQPKRPTDPLADTLANPNGTAHSFSEAIVEQNNALPTNCFTRI